MLRNIWKNQMGQKSLNLIVKSIESHLVNIPENEGVMMGEPHKKAWLLAKGTETAPQRLLLSPSSPSVPA